MAETNIYKKGQQNDLKFWIKFAIMSFTLMMLLLFNEHYALTKVSGNSMSPTLRSGQYGLASRNVSEIKHGDIVVVELDDFSNSSIKERLIVKRVLGVPGDMVDFKDGVIKINGTIIESHSNRTNEENYSSVSYEIPEGMYWIQGDNVVPNMSMDSRLMGPVDISTIVYKLVKPKKAVDAYMY